jgi:hypothetical protein
VGKYFSTISLISVFIFQLVDLINSTAQKAAEATLQALSGPNSPFGSPAMSLTNENFNINFSGPGIAATATSDATKTAGLDPSRLHSVRGHHQQVQADVHQYPPGAVGGTLPKTVSTPSQTTATTAGISGEGMVTSSFSNTGQFNPDNTRYRSGLLDAHQHAAKERLVQTDQEKQVDDDIQKKPLALGAVKESFF